MISKNGLNNMFHKLHLADFIDSHKRLLKDNRGGFLLPMEIKIKGREYERYRHLPVNWSISSITKEDLPEEFSHKEVNTVDMFRRKTLNLDLECMIFFDIETGNIIFCKFADENNPNEVWGEIYPNELNGMHIASVHNHPKQYCSPPSSKNFEMLGLKFEEFEIISSQKELWILKSCETIFNQDIIHEIRRNVDEYFNLMYNDISFEFEEGYLVIDNLNKIYGDFLLNYLNNEFENIKLTRRYLDV